MYDVFVNPLCNPFNSVGVCAKTNCLQIGHYSFLYGL